MSYYSLHGDQAKEREEDSDSDSDLDSDNVTTEKDSGGMSDDDMLGNPFQSMAIEISGMPELGGEHNQAGAVKGEGKWFRLVQVHTPIANVPRRLLLLHHNTVKLKVLLVKGKMKVMIARYLVFKLLSFSHMNKLRTLMLGGYTSYKTSRTASRARFEPIFGRNLGRSSVVIALEKALPDLINHCTESGAGPSSSPTKICSGSRKELCIYETPKNKSAALVFAAECMKGRQGRQGENHTLEDVSKAWLTHVMALRMWYKHKQLDELNEKECKAQNRQRQRKNELSFAEAGTWPYFTTSLNDSKGARRNRFIGDIGGMGASLVVSSVASGILGLVSDASYCEESFLSAGTASGMECSIREQMCHKSTWDMGHISSKSWWVAPRVKGLISCGRHKEEE
ncbi:hypothetical protein EDC04DRAFT_2599900 [Pisolithus marmoratus]|nr:hypothetical protein EDC04DRAFT_2599900 [Pisolithus marmoratus]